MTTVDETDGGGQEGGGQEGAGQEDGKKRGTLIPLLIVGLVGLGGGGAVGGMTLGPKIGEQLAQREIEGGRPSSGGGGHGDAEETSLHIIDNLVVNPAQSAGTRFLLTSVAIQLLSPDAADLLLALDVELRDALIMVLGTKTVDELTDISRRSSIVQEIRVAIEHVTGPEIIRNIFLPQFVLQ